MKREEAKELFRTDKDAYGKPRSIMHKIDRIYDDFESDNKKLEKEKLQEIIEQIESEDPYCGIENMGKALSDLIRYLEENNIKVVKSNTDYVI